MADNNGKELCQRAEQMFSRRAATDALRQEIALQFGPDLAHFQSMPYEGEEFGAHLLEIHGAIYAREFTGALSSLLRPAGKKWFRATVGDEDRLTIEGKRFFDYISNVTWALLTEKKGQFTRAAMIMDRQVGLFGENAMTIEERGDPRDPGLLYRTWHLKDVAFAEDHEGNPATPARRFELPAIQVCRKFKGLEGASIHPEVEKMAEKDPQKKVRLRHCVIEAEDYEYQTRRKAPRGVRYVSAYVDADNDHLIREKPALWDPYVISRWQVVPTIPDGWSPATRDALPISRRAQEIALSILESAHKQADPPLIATAAAIINGEINTGNGMVTYVDKDYDEKTGAALRPLDIGGDMRVALEVQRDTRQAMELAFFINKLAMPNERPQTAYEASLRFQEFIRGSLPIIEPLEAETNVKILDKVVEIGMHVGAYGPLEEIMPDELSNEEIVFQFENPLRDALDSEKVVEFQRIIEMVGAAAQIDPEAPVVFNAKKALTDAASTTRHNDWLLSEEEVARKIEEIQQRAAMQQQMAMLQQGGEAAAKLGKGVNEAGPAIEQLMAGAGA